MIDANELSLRIKMSIELNQEFYPNSAFTSERSDMQLPHASTSLVTPNSKIALIIEQAMHLVKNQRKVQLMQIIVSKILKHLDLKDMDMRVILAKAIAAMPTAHRLIARKEYDTLKLALPIIQAVSAAKVSIETYGPEDDAGYDDLYSRVDLLNQNLLHLAALNHDYRAFAMLVNSGAVTAEDCLVEDIQGLTPLYIILSNTQNPCQRKSYEALTMLKLLLKKEWLKIDEPCLGNQSLLHFAAQTNNVLLCELLLKLKANVNVVNKLDGNTPLHYACQANCLEAAGVLLDHKANPLLINRKELTPAQVASNFGYKPLMCLLRENTIAAVGTPELSPSGAPSLMSLNLEYCGHLDEDMADARTEQYHEMQDKHFFAKTPRKEEMELDELAGSAKRVLFSTKARETAGDKPEGHRRITRAKSESSLLHRVHKFIEVKPAMPKAQSTRPSLRQIATNQIQASRAQCRRQFIPKYV